MKRRRFVAMTTGGIGLIGAGAVGGLWWFCPGPSTTDSAAAHLEQIARSMTGATSAGRAWRLTNPDADPRAYLLRNLGFGPNEKIDRDALIEALAARVEQEFAENHLFEHDHWMLSQTETQLAALHVSLLGANAVETRSPSFETAPEARLVSLERYNPKKVTQGEPLTHPGLPENVIWFGTSDPPPPRFRVVVDGTSLTTNASENGFSIRVPDPLRYQLFEKPGDHEIWLYDPVVDRRQRLGTITVVEVEAADDEFCEVTAWGPQQTEAGSTFNEQPDGASAFWLRVDCFPPGTVVVLAGTEVPTTLHPDDGLITTHIKNRDLYARPGNYAVELMDSATGRTQEVGIFIVRP